MEEIANEVACGNNDGSPNSECGGGGSVRSCTHSTAKARAVYLRLQRRGSCSGGTGESACAEAESADSDSSIEGSTDCEPGYSCSVFTGWRSARQRLGGSTELEAAPRGIECRRGERGGGFTSMGDRGCHADT